VEAVFACISTKSTRLSELQVPNYELGLLTLRGSRSILSGIGRSNKVLRSLRSNSVSLRQCHCPEHLNAASPHDFSVFALENIDEVPEPQSENHALRRELIALDRRISAIERSIVFRALRKTGLVADSFKRRAGKSLLASPFHRLYHGLMGESRQRNQYAAWLETHRRCDPLAGKQIPANQATTRFSVILPTKSPNVEWLRLAVESVLQQTWPNWQLCIAEDGEIAAPVRRWLDDLAKSDHRVTLVRGGAPGISGTLNRGIEAADGEFLAFLGHDDLLEVTALAHIAIRLEAKASDQIYNDLVYTDEDVIDENGRPKRSNFKPGWSPALLRTCMYMGHLIVARRERVLDAGGFDSSCDGSQDFDLVLKLIDRGAVVDQLPRVLYHWREHKGSTAQSAARPYMRQAGKDALAASLRRRGISAEVTCGERPDTYRIRHSFRAPAVTIIIPSRNPILLGRCLKALRAKTAFPGRLELIVVHHETDASANSAMQKIIQDNHARVISFDGPFHFARMMNKAAEMSSGELLIFMNDDIEPKGPDWLSDLTAPLAIPDVGVTGARLLYPNGTIQHAGMVLGMGDATGHGGRFLMDSPWWPWINFTRDITSVTGACLATTKQLFQALNGFDLRFPNNYNDVDYCLRARLAGFGVVLENDAVLVHHEGLTRTGGTTLDERISFFTRWGHLLDAPDRFFTPHLRTDREDLSLDFREHS
jgi:GT2 family glycosyltransferase